MRLVLALALLVGAACRTPDATPAPGPAGAPDGAAPQVAAPSQAAPKGSGALHLLFTTDEHGWLAPLVDADTRKQRGGVVPLYDQLQRVEGYGTEAARRAQGYLLLSCGDMWTGPYETTLLEGAPMVAAMGHMGYAAASVGNHDFDFGVRILSEHSSKAPFPLLAANLVESATGEAPRWVKPFTVLEAGGLKVGVVGLTNVDSPVTSDPRHLTGLTFLPYAEALEHWIPRVRAAGADEVVVLVHEVLGAADSLMPTLRKHRVRAAAFGHHHQAGSRIDDGGTADLEDDVTVCNAGAYMRSYCRIDLRFDAGKLTERAVKVTPVELAAGATPAKPDPILVDIVKSAEHNAQKVGGEVLVESKRVLQRGPAGALGQLVVDAWLKALPYTQVAITNAGGLRQDLAAGPVRVRDVVSVLPFNNYLLVVELSGAELRQVLANEESIAAGVRYAFSDGAKGRRITSLAFSDGRLVADDARLKVVINDFMYRGGDRYPFAALDAEPEETAIDWREPVLRHLRELGRQGKVLELSPDDRARKR